MTAPALVVEEVARAAAEPRTESGALVVDARALHASGIGRYLRELLGCWLREPPFSRLVLLGEPPELPAWLEAQPVDAGLVTVVAHRGGFYTPAAQRSWLRVRRDGAVAHAAATFFPHWDAPLVAMPRRSLVTVHDLIPFRVPDAFPASRRIVAAPALRRVLRTARRVICVSEASARDVRQWYPPAATRLSVILNGVSERFADGEPGAAPLAGRYLLCVGNQKPHKNLAAAVGVLARLRSTGYQDLRLLVVGRRFDDRGDVLSAARAAGVAEAVVAVDAADDGALHAAYAHCAALLFPSRYEGFGLPVLEAMTAGAPVVASTARAVVEVAGDAAALHPPDDVAGMAASVAALLDDAEHRARVIARGRARAAAYRWTDAARATARELHGIARAGASA